MKTTVLKLALAALALLTAAVALYVIVYTVVFGAMIALGIWLAYRAGRLHQRYLAWKDARECSAAAREEAEAHYAAQDAAAARSQPTGRQRLLARLPQPARITAAPCIDISR